jgi:tRNA-splicing endonuclease subunit Sen2
LSQNKAQMGATELWDLLASGSEQFVEMYRVYQHLRLKNWFVRSGLQYRQTLLLTVIVRH